MVSRCDLTVQTRFVPHAACLSILTFVVRFVQYHRLIVGCNGRLIVWSSQRAWQHWAFADIPRRFVFRDYPHQRCEMERVGTKDGTVWNDCVPECHSELVRWVLVLGWKRFTASLPVILLNILQTTFDKRSSPQISSAAARFSNVILRQPCSNSAWIVSNVVPQRATGANKHSNFRTALFQNIPLSVLAFGGTIPRRCHTHRLSGHIQVNYTAADLPTIHLCRSTTLFLLAHCFVSVARSLEALFVCEIENLDVCYAFVVAPPIFIVHSWLLLTKKLFEMDFTCTKRMELFEFTGRQVLYLIHRITCLFVCSHYSDVSVAEVL